jgi:hypothetical protein
MIHKALHGQRALWASISVLKGCGQHEVCTCRFNTAYHNSMLIKKRSNLRKD